VSHQSPTDHLGGGGEELRHTPSVESTPCPPAIKKGRPLRHPPTHRARELTVTFHVLEPMTPERSFASGHLPVREVLNTIKELDRSSDSYRIRNGISANETFCHIHDDGPLTLIGTYNKDLVSRLLLEYQGDLEEIRLRDGEGPVDALYTMLFPGDVVGVLRTSTKAPGPAGFANWMSIQGQHPFYLSALPDPGALDHLRQRQGLIRRVEVGVNRHLLRRLNPAVNPLGVAAALRALADGCDATSSIELTLRNSDRKIRSQLDAGVEDLVFQFADVVPDFNRLKVFFTGERRPLDLRRSYVSTPMSVRLTQSKRVGPHEAGEALIEAYDREQSAIDSALQIWRNRRS
jgi:hypothetical protein